MSKPARLSVDVPVELRTEVKIYISLTPRTSIQSIVTDLLLQFLGERAGCPGESPEAARYAMVANKELLKDYIPELIEELTDESELDSEMEPA